MDVVVVMHSFKYVSISLFLSLSSHPCIFVYMYAHHTHSSPLILAISYVQSSIERAGAKKLLTVEWVPMFPLFSIRAISFHPHCPPISTNSPLSSLFLCYSSTVCRIHAQISGNSSSSRSAPAADLAWECRKLRIARHRTFALRVA